MTINILSDIHCDGEHFPQHLNFDNLDKTDVLVIAGDIGTFDNRDKIIDQLTKKYQYNKFDHLITVWGNHDYYVLKHSDLKKAKRKYQPPSEKDNFVKIIDDVAFICSPMWTRLYDLMFVESCMNDYDRIPKFTATKENELFDYNYKWIISNIKEFKSKGFKTIVVTHHGPNPKCIEPRYMNHPLNEAFYCIDENICKEFIDAESDVWIYGHSHSFDDRMIGKTRFIRNPYGYDWPTCEEYLYTGFKLNTILEI